MEINQIIWNLAVAFRKASVRALSNLNQDNDFNNWRVIYMQQLWYCQGRRDIFTSLLESTKSYKQPTITYDRKKTNRKACPWYSARCSKLENSFELQIIQKVLRKAAIVPLNLQIRVLKIRRRELMDETLFRLFPR